MSQPCQLGAGPPAPAPPPAGSLDTQILVTWQALLLNPDLDPRQALDAIDRLLDQRARHAADRTASARPLNRALPAGSAAQHAILAEVLAMLL
jgi:hypothetical protein